MSNTTTGRIPLWFVGTVAGLAALGLLTIFFLWIICRTWFISLRNQDYTVLKTVILKNDNHTEDGQ